MRGAFRRSMAALGPLALALGTMMGGSGPVSPVAQVPVIQSGTQGPQQQAAQTPAAQAITQAVKRIYSGSCGSGGEEHPWINCHGRLLRQCWRGR